MLDMKKVSDNLAHRLSKVKIKAIVVIAIDCSGGMHRIEYGMKPNEGQDPEKNRHTVSPSKQAVLWAQSRKGRRDHEHD